ncbi:MAG: SCP2 sterol-binding domain-containing protein [Archangium sp.]|nr:SCP2 sterol-binding domain-containing protein [Archangium sp.]
MSWLDTLEDIRKKDFSKVPMAQRDAAARDVVNMASYACAVVAISPIPFSDAVLMLPVQSAMVVTVGHVYGRKVTEADAKSLIVELAATAGLGMLARQGIKAILPVFGALLTVPAAFAMNWGIGRVAMEYFRNPGMPREQLKKIYEAAKEEGAGLFSKERFDMFRKSSAAQTEADEVEEEDDAPKKKGSKKKPARKKPLSAIQKLVEVDFTARLAKNKDVRDAFDGVVHLDITGSGGGAWTADLTKPTDWISRGHEGSPKLTIRAEAKDFTALVKGEKNAQLAVMNGDLTLEPMDLDLAMKLGPLFSAA